MNSYTVHYVTADGTARTVVSRAENALSAQAGVEAHLLPSDTVVRVSQVNDHKQNSQAGLQAHLHAPVSPYTDCIFDRADPDDDVRCNVHGGWRAGRARCQTIEVLDDVRAERARQFARYGTNEDIEDGTGPDVRWLGGVGLNLDLNTAEKMEAGLRAAYEAYEARHGAPTWRHLVLEEVAEAFQERDLKRLREEVLQVAALAVSWVEKIDSRIEAGER